MCLHTNSSDYGTKDRDPMLFSAVIPTPAISIVFHSQSRKSGAFLWKIKFIANVSSEQEKTDINEMMNIFHLYFLCATVLFTVMCT